MQLDDVSETLRDWMEIVRAWVLDQTWLGLLHDWIASAAGSTIWVVFLGSIAMLILMIGFWPAGRPK